MQLPFQVDLKDKVVVITGGAGVIGSEMSRALAKSGARVAIVSLNNTADDLVKEIEEG
ncbi:SDR family NAD(P)-dependent oxidoreductase, partial [Staphylococcus agnetis]